MKKDKPVLIEPGTIWTRNKKEYKVTKVDNQSTFSYVTVEDEDGIKSTYGNKAFIGLFSKL